jgi:excisionase family DNA binding protein
LATRVTSRARRAKVAEPWLSADDIAAHLGITKDTVYTWIADKAMPAHKVGRLWKFQANEIDDWVRRGAAAVPTTGEDTD